MYSRSSLCPSPFWIKAEFVHRFLFMMVQFLRKDTARSALF